MLGSVLMIVGVCSIIHLFIAVKALFAIFAQMWDDEGKSIKLGDRAQYACLDPEERGDDEGQDNARTTLLRSEDEGEML